MHGGTRTTWLLGIVSLMTACPSPDGPAERNPVTLPGCIEVVTDEVVLEPVDITQSPVVPSSTSLRLTNACPGVLALDAASVQGTAGPGVFSVEQPSQLRLEEGQSTSVEIRFLATAATEYEDLLRISSNDPARPILEIPLRGTGLGPRIEVSPIEVDFGSALLGCEQNQAITLRNAGTSELVVQRPQVFTPSIGELSVDADPLTNGDPPFRLAPGSEISIWLDYLPLDTFPDDGFVRIQSDDPARPEVIVTAEGTGEVFGDHTDVFEQRQRAAADLIITIDRTETMTERSEAIARSFGTLYDAFRFVNLDLHATVIVAEDGCPLGPTAYVDGTFSRDQAVSALRTMADLDGDLLDVPDPPPGGLSVLEAAFSSDNLRRGGCNADWYREGASLWPLHITEGPDRSPNSWSYYVSVAQSLKADPEHVIFSAVGGDYPSGCGSAEAGTGYYEATVATGGLFLSICGPDWPGNLESLPSRARVDRRSFELTRQPVPQTIEVEIDGVLVNTGWEYDISSNSIKFEEAPAGGSLIEVYYQRLPDCSGR